MILRHASGYHVWHPWTDMARMTQAGDPLHLTRARGSFVHAEDRAFFDASAGLWNVNLGHGDGRVSRAIAQALDRLTFHSLIDTPSRAANRLAAALLENAPPNLARVMFHCSGTAATEGALLTLRQLAVREGHPRKFEIVAIAGGFHGSSYLMTAVSGLPDDADQIAPLPDGIHHIPAPLDARSARAGLDALRRLLETRGPERLQSFIAEPVMGCEGALALPRDWLAEAVALCRTADMTIVADEVATGLGRCGSWFAWPQGVPVDALVVGKGLSAGYLPLAATLFDGTIFSRFTAARDHGPLRYGSTMDGCPAALAAGLAVLEILAADDVPGKVRATRQAIEPALAALAASPMVKGIDGAGLMIGIRLCDPADAEHALSAERVHEVCARLRQAGVLLDPEGRSALLFYPPLTARVPEIEDALETVTDVLSEMSRGPRQDRSPA